MNEERKLGLVNYLWDDIKLHPVDDGPMVRACLRYAKEVGHTGSYEDIWIDFQESDHWQEFFPED